MTTKNFFFIAIISIFTFSCDSNDDDSNSNPENNPESIIGEWSYTSQTLNGDNIAFQDECQQNNEHQTYSSNGDYEQTEFENLSGTGCEQVTSSTGTYTLENNILNFTQNGEPYTAQILELNDSTLKYELSIDYDDDGSIDEFTQTLTKI